MTVRAAESPAPDDFLIARGGRFLRGPPHRRRLVVPPGQRALLPVLRWLWRFVVWGLLLRDLARLDLQLAVTHPDRVGGPGFISQYPPVRRASCRS